LLISLETLAEDNLLDPSDTENPPPFPRNHADYGGVELLEGLTSCQAIDKVPKILILGGEPFDIKTVDLDPPQRFSKKWTS